MIFQPMGGAGGGLSFSELSRAAKSLIVINLPGTITIPVPNGAKMTYVFASYSDAGPYLYSMMSTFLMPGESQIADNSTASPNITATWSGNSIVVSFNGDIGRGAMVNITFFI